MGKLRINPSGLPREKTIVYVDKPVIVEVPVDRIVVKTVELIKEIEKLVYVDKIVEVMKEVPVEITHHIEVPIDREVVKLVDVIKEVEKAIYIDRIVPLEKIVLSVPLYIKICLIVETLAVIGLLIR